MASDALALVQFADRIGLNLAALLTIGFALHIATGVVERDGRARFRSFILTAAGLLVAVALARLLLLVAQLGDGANLIDPELLPLAWTALGPSTALLIGAAMAAAAGVLSGLRALAGLGALAIAGGFGLTGHTQGIVEPGFLPVAATLHVLIAGFWVAAPVTLFPHAALSDWALSARLKRFSAMAIFAIPLLLVLGVWLALSLAGSPDALLGSAYGWLLLMKLAIGLGAMTLGAFNKQVITAKVLADSPRGRRWLRTALLAEATLFLIAIVSVSAATTIAGPSN